MECPVGFRCTIEQLWSSQQAFTLSAIAVVSIAVIVLVIIILMWNLERRKK